MRRLLAVLATVSLVVAGCSSGVNPPPPKPNMGPLAERGVILDVSNHPSVENSLKLGVRLNAIFDYMQGLNVNAVALHFSFFTDGPTGSTVATGKETPSPVMLERIILAAQARHLKVKLRPSVVIANTTAEVDLNPENRDQWFATYAAVLKPYAELSRKTGVTEFQVGDRLSTLEGDPRWKGVLTTLQSVYRGTLSYTAAGWSLEDGTAKPPTDIFGMAAYTTFNAEDYLTVESLTGAWDKWLDTIGARYALRRLVLDEVGIPWSDAWPGQPDPQMQTKWFTAACAAARTHNVPGVYFWRLDLSRDPAHMFADGEQPTQFVGRPGEAAIRACFAD